MYPQISPALISNEISLIAFTPLNDFTRLLTLII